MAARIVIRRSHTSTTRDVYTRIHNLCENGMSFVHLEDQLKTWSDDGKDMENRFPTTFKVEDRQSVLDIHQRSSTYRCVKSKSPRHAPLTNAPHHHTHTHTHTHTYTCQPWKSSTLVESCILRTTLSQCLRLSRMQIYKICDELSLVDAWTKCESL